MPARIVYANMQLRLLELGLTESDLLQHKGITKRLLNDLASHKANPTISTLAALAKALQTPPHALFMTRHLVALQHSNGNDTLQ